MRKLLLAIAFAATLANVTEAQQAPDPRVADIVHSTKIRIGVFPATQYSKDPKTGEQKGLALNISRALAARAGVAEVIPVEHPNPVAVVACVKAGGCDLGLYRLSQPASPKWTSPLRLSGGTSPIWCRPAPQSAAPRMRIAREFASQPRAVMLRRRRWSAFSSRPNRYSPRIRSRIRPATHGWCGRFRVSP